VSHVIERFSRILRDRPARPLIHLPLTRTTITAEALWAAAERQRRHLQEAGIGPGDLILYSAGNRPELLAVWLASRMLDAALMPMDPGAAPAEIDASASRFGAGAVFIGAGASPAGHWEPVIEAEGLTLLQPRAISHARGTYAGAAVLKLTSGSSGLPKATFTTEAQLVEDTTHIVGAMGITEDDCQMAVIPLSHAYGFGNLLMPAVLNGTAMVLREAFVPQQLAADAGAYGARVLHGVPFMFDHFNAHLPPGAWPPGLELLVSAGARLDASTVRAFSSSFGLKVHSFYGTTETGGIAFDDSPEVDDEPGVGWPLPSVTVTLVPDDDAPEDGGRVHVSGSAVASGYAGGEPFDGGPSGEGFLTGDFGCFKAGGRLVLTGRASSFINVAGKKVQPDEVEQVLRELPGVSDVRVVGMPDPARGQQIVACLVAPGERPSVLTVRQFCAARLAPHKIPRTVILLDRIPLTERGKTDRRSLEAAVAERLRGAPGSGVL
jgi:long-chain acyl-CoA synthetase